MTTIGRAASSRQPASTAKSALRRSSTTARTRASCSDR